jgi:hypothetical protein
LHPNQALQPTAKAAAELRRYAARNVN